MYKSKKTVEELLVLQEKGHSYSTDALKKRLFREGVLDRKCAACGLGPEWMGSDLSLQIDHINGLSWDNRLSNLRILCPNCHSQTDTYAGKNCKKEKICMICSKSLRGSAKNCRSCYLAKERSKKFLVEENELKTLLTKHNIEYIAKIFGVTGNAIRKRAKKLGLPVSLKERLLAREVGNAPTSEDLETTWPPWPLTNRVSINR